MGTTTTIDGAPGGRRGRAARGAPSAPSARDREPDPLRLLADLWLAEPSDEVVDALRRTPALAAAVPAGPAAAVRLALAVAWLDLVSRQVPPHESVFLDPTAMLDAPATARLRDTLDRAGWSMPPGLRVPAADQLGVVLLALSDLCDRDGLAEAASAVLVDHLLVWLPLFGDAVAHAAVHPLYAAAADATVDAVLDLADRLPAAALPASAAAVVPALPPPPRYRANGAGDGVEAWPVDDGAAPGDARLRDVLDALLVPREAGLYLGRADIARCAAALDLPVGLGDRRLLLRGAFEAAGRHDAVGPFLDALDRRWAAAAAAHARLAAAHPSWTVYAAAWRARIDATRAAVAGWRGDVDDVTAAPPGGRR